MLRRWLLALGLALVLLATAVGVLAVVVRLSWQPVPPPAATTFDARAAPAASETSALRLLLLPAALD